MCFVCDGGSFDQYRRMVAAHIEEVGWHVVGVEANDLRPGWAYTIGLAERFGHPELVLTGMHCLECAAETLNGVGALVAAGAGLEPGAEVALDDGQAVRLGAVHPRHWQTTLLNQWLNYYDALPWEGPPRAALQVITRGRSGRWQDDPADRRWRRLRLDRPPHVGGGRRTARQR